MAPPTCDKCKIAIPLTSLGSTEGYIHVRECDKCKRAIPRKEERWHCKCDYDLCIQCHPVDPAPPVLTLDDPTVSLSPYFKLKDVAKFKDVWKAAFDPFAHKKDCVHYAFTFHTAADGTVYAHCREAYTSAATVLQHLADVDGPLKAALEVAELERLEVHGPAAEVEKLKEALTPLGCKFFVTEWGFRPSKPQEKDTVCHLYPYFTLKDAPAFKKIWGDAYAATQAAAEAEKSHMYAFAFEGETTAHCREAYADADSVLLHLKNVDGPLKAVLDPAVAELLRLELHGPASEIEKLKPALGPLGCKFFEIGWGFRNAVPTQNSLALTDPTVSLSPYFKLKDVAEFKAVWKAAFDPFAHKKDCVHYAFTFHTAEDGTVYAHCREAYTSAATVLQHLTDVDGPLKAALKVAELERLEVHGPAAEIEKLKEALTPLGCKFFVTEWGFRPSKPQEKDTVCHLYPYFTLKDASAFKKIWGDAYAATQAAAEAEKSHMYAFAFEGETTAHCREAYADADSVLLHLKNVDRPLKAVLDPAVADLLRLELHGPASEIEKLKPALEPLGCKFFEIEWGFRN